MKTRFIFTTVMLVAFTLSSCASQRSANVNLPPLDLRSELESDRAESIPSPEKTDSIESPDALTEDLLSLSLSAPAEDVYIDIEAKQRPAKLFFSDLGKSQNINILVDPLVNGPISLSLRNVTLKQVISALQDSYGYDFQKTSYGYRVSPNQMATRVYRLNYLNVERSGESKTQIGGDESNTVTTTFSANSDKSDSNFWSSIQKSVEGFTQNNGAGESAVIVNPQTGLLVVTATSSQHNAITQFLVDAQLIIQKQVIIEAKIVEVILDQEYRSGINWSFLNDNAGGNESLGFGINADNLAGTGGVGGVFNLSLSLDNFTSVLQLLDYQGDAQVLSSPRVSTVNNQKAVIKVGSDEFFASVTSIVTDTEDSAVVSPSIEMLQFFSGIALDVTPQISEDDTVTLHVRPTVTEVIEQTKEIDFAGSTYSLPLAYSNIRESDSIIRAKSGQIVVIGGLLQQKQDLGTTSIPWFGKIPVARLLFAQDRESKLKSELVILLKPTVYNQDTSMTDIDRVLERLE